MTKATAPVEDAPTAAPAAEDTGKGTEGDHLTGPPAPEPAQAAPEAKPTAAELARKGLVCLEQLNKDTLARMQQQALAPTWKLDSAGGRLVESKEETKKKLRRSSAVPSAEPSDAGEPIVQDAGQLARGWTGRTLAKLPAVGRMRVP